MNNLINFILRRKPKFSPRIFEHRSWLERQVQEEKAKQTYYREQNSRG